MLFVLLALQLSPTVQPASTTSVFAGEVTRLDEESRSVTLRDDEEMERTFWWTDQTRMTRDSREVGPEEIVLGRRVEVVGQEQSGKWLALEIRID